MKKISFILLAMILSIGLISAQQTATAPAATGDAKFKELAHDFGKVAEEVGSISTEFEFKNTGKKPIIIQDVRTSCGCTTPSYTKDPVLPGKKGTVKVSYSTTGRIGAFDKKITIFTNEPDNVYTLTIKGEVLPRK